MKPLYIALALLGCLNTAHAAELTNDQLVNYCNAILLEDIGVSHDTDYPPHFVVGLYSTTARHYFARRSFAQKRRQLQRLQRLPLSTGASQSVAYISALNGIHPYRNAQRLLSAPFSQHPLYPRMAELGEMVYDRVWKIYDRFPDRRIALLLLEEQNSDGAGATVARSARLRMFRNQPRFILALAMQAKPAFTNLSRDFSHEATENELPSLRRLCHDPDLILRRGARQIRHHIHAHHSRFNLPYPQGK